MKLFNKLSALGAVVAAMLLLPGCQKADPEFVHTNNLISSLYFRMNRQDTGTAAVITEYDKNGNVLTGDDITAEKADGGWGEIDCSVGKSKEKDIDLTQVYLTASLTFDETITPGLTGPKDVIGERDSNGEAQGFVITVTSGNGKKRMYRIYGDYKTSLDQ